MNNFEVEGTLERMKMIKRGAPLSTLWPSDIDIIINALEKRILKKIKYEKVICADGFKYTKEICSSCGEELNSYFCFDGKFCPDCGQAINWEGAKDNE